MLVLDSVTYQEVSHSEFIRTEFGFISEKKLDHWKGLYLIGESNYLELFHPKSIKNENLNPGVNWICLTSMKSNYIQQLDTSSVFIYDYDEQFNYYSLALNDSTYPITTQEMKQAQYESWVKKPFHESMEFNPVDYNSPADADSSKNFPLQDIVAIHLTINSNDSLSYISYLSNCGYTITNTVDTPMFRTGIKQK